MTPTKIYVKAIQSLIGKVDVKGISHITGGGFYENVPRMMTQGLTARIELDSFPKLPIFQLIQDKGNIPERDMYNTFNMGIGMIMIVDEKDADAVLKNLADRDEKAYVIGKVVDSDVPVTLRGGVFHD